jgi:hypothetical protein
VTRTVPIVSAVLNDPIREGVIESYAHPGGNVTGIMNTIEGLPGKLLEITLELVPRATGIGFLINPENLATTTQWREIDVAAIVKGLEAENREIRTADDLPSAFESFSSAGVKAVIVSRDTVRCGVTHRGTGTCRTPAHNRRWKRGGSRWRAWKLWHEPDREQLVALSSRPSGTLAHCNDGTTALSAMLP